MPCAVTCKELQTVILSEVSQKKKEQYHMILESKRMMQIFIKQNHIMQIGRIHLMVKGEISPLTQEDLERMKI